MNTKLPTSQWWRLVRVGCFVAGLCCLARLPAQSAPPLTTLQYHILGTQLRVSPTAVSVPKGVAGSVLIRLTNGDDSTNFVNRALSDDAYVEAILRGPSFPARRLVGRLNEALVLPMLSLVGDYQLDQIRLIDATTGAVRLEGTPTSVPVHVFDEVLVSQVTSRPLTLEEVQQKGIVIDSENFRAVEFEIAFVLDGVTIPVKFPVVAPTFKESTELIPQAELERRSVEAKVINDQIASVLQLEGLPPQLERPGLNLQIKGVNFQPAIALDRDLRLNIPPIPAIMVIPGNIGFLSQFFSVQIFTENGAPVNSGLSVVNVMAAMKLPPGRDGIVSTNYSQPGDDPLRFARVGPNQELQNVLPILGPDPDKVARFQPGRGGSAEFLVEGMQEGLHVMDLELTADLDGLAAGTVKVKGLAAGSVLVRNPKFSLAFSHPRTVRFGETNLARVTVLNTGDSVANLLSVTLRGTSISGAVLESEETVQLGTLAPGQSATATYRLRSQRNGYINFNNLTTSDNSVQGRFNLTLGVDERGVELSPDSIGMPDYVNNLPQAVLNAANRVLGQALSVATAGRLPAGVRPIARGVITRRVLDLAEAGQRVRYGDSLKHVLADLQLDWLGGREFTSGFDQIIRENDAGREFREALAAALEIADGLNATARLEDRAADLVGRGEAWHVASVSVPQLEVGMTLGPDSVTLDRSAVAQSAAFRGANSGHWLVTKATNEVIRWDVKGSVPQAELAVLKIGMDGTGTLLRWTVAAPPVNGCLTYDPAGTDVLQIDRNCDGTPDSQLASETRSVTERPPGIQAVFQDIQLSFLRPFSRCSVGPANNYGNIIAVLFSKPMTQTNANIPSAYKLDNGNVGVGVQIQPGGRVAYVSLKEPISAIIARELTVDGVTDRRGNQVINAPHAIEAALLNGVPFHDGVALRGRVIRADGNPAIGVPVTVTFYDPWRDPFDNCMPTIITRIAQKFTDENGGFDLDFVHGGVQVTIAAVDTGGLPSGAVASLLAGFQGNQFAKEKFIAQLAQSNALASAGVTTVAEAVALAEGLDRAVWEDNINLSGGRIGTELVIALRFRGRGIVRGQVVGPDGLTPVAQAAVNLFPDTTSREQGRGIFSDASGRFQFNGVPLGNFTVQVQSPLRHFRTVVGRLDLVNETKELKVVLTAPATNEIIRTTIRGRVMEPDNVMPHAGARVFVLGSAGASVAIATSDDSGFWEAKEIPLDRYAIQAVTQDRRRSGTASVVALQDSIAFVNVTLSGTGVVRGRVENSSGVPMTNALVAGGEGIVRTDTNGLFTLNGVPLGQRTIQAGIEGSQAPGGYPRLGSASVWVLPGTDNFVVIRLRAAGQIEGVVHDANGNPVPGVNVAIPVAGGFAWVKANNLGHYKFINMAIKSYVVVAPSPPVNEKANAEPDPNASDEEAADQLIAAINESVTIYTRRIDPSASVGNTFEGPGSFGYTPAQVSSDGQTVLANITYLPTGKITGTVRNDQGVPIGARVMITGIGVNEDATVGLIPKNPINSDPSTGQFEFQGITAGPWGVQCASPFYPVVLSQSGATTKNDRDVLGLVLQFPPIRDFNGRLVGAVFNPDGSPVGDNVRVKINFTADYEIRTDTNGLFDTQINIPARTYTVEAIDENTGLRGKAQVSVTPGQTNGVAVRLLGKGGLAIIVNSADGRPVTNAVVEVKQGTYPGEHFEGQTDADGVLRLTNIFEGRYAVYVDYRNGISRFEGRLSLDVAWGQITNGTITLGPTGCLRGHFVRREDGAPIAGARVAIGGVAYVTTGPGGEFEVRGLALGTYRLIATHPVTGRVGASTATLTYSDQVLDVSMVELALGTIRGQFFRAGQVAPIPGGTITLVQDTRLAVARTVTTGPDGSFEFPGVIPGAFTLSATGAAGGTSFSASQSGTFPDQPTTLTINLTAAADPRIGRLTVQVFEPDGVTPATNAHLTQPAPADTDGNGQVIYERLVPARYQIVAFSRRTAESSSAGGTNAIITLTDTNVTNSVTLSGVCAINGRVIQSDGTSPASGAQVNLIGRSSFIGVPGAAVTGTAGQFHFDNLPVGSYRLDVKSGPLAASYNGQFTRGGVTDDVTMRLGASGTVTGRLFRADGTNVVPNQETTLSFSAPSGLDGLALSVTDTNGGFCFDNIPIGEVMFQAVRFSVDGLAKATGHLVSNGQTLDLGPLVLDEDWPYVQALDPANGASGVPIAAPVIITFSEALKPSSLNTNGIYLQGPSNQVAATLQLLADTNGIARIVRLTPKAPLKSLTSYQLIVFDGLRFGATGKILGTGPVDRVERPLLTAFNAAFTTRDDDPPQVVSIFPSNSSVQIDPRAVLRVSFNEPVSDSALVFNLNGPHGPVSGVTAMTLNGLAVTFASAAALDVNARYTVNLSGVRDLAGNALLNQPITSSFDTLDTRGPTNAVLRLADGKSPVAGSALFVEAVFANTNEPGVSVWFTANLNSLGTSTHPPFRVPFTMPTTGIVTFRAIATDRYGNDEPLAEFRVAVVPDLRPPRLTMADPTNGALRQSLWLTNGFGFDEALAPGTATTNNVVVTSSAGLDAPFTVGLANSNQQLLVRLEQPLRPGVTYTNTLRPGLTDASGNRWELAGGNAVPDEGMAFNFTTATILAVTPTNGTATLAGRSLVSSVNYESGLGARFFRFLVNGAQAAQVAAGPTNTSAMLVMPNSGAQAIITIVAADDAAFSAPFNLSSVTVNVLPLNTDHDGDGIPNDFEIINNLDPLRNDAGEDPDSDGLTNLQEFQRGTLPRVADTDGDGLPDGTDPNPLEVSTGLFFAGSNRVDMIEGQTTNLLLQVSSPSGPIVLFDYAPTNLPPAFVSVKSRSVASTISNNIATLELEFNPLHDAAGQHVITLRAANRAGASDTLEIRLVVADNPALAMTRWKDSVSGNWSDASRWDNGLPNATSVAVIDASGTYTVSLNTAVTAAGIVLNASNAVLQPTFSPTLNMPVEVRRGLFSVNTTTTLVLNRPLANRDRMRWVTRFNYFTLRGSGRVENLGTWELYRDPTGPNGSGSSVGVSVNVPVGGKLLLSTNALVLFTMQSSLNVAGELEIQSGALLRLDSTTPARTVTLAAESLLSGAGALQLDGSCQVMALGDLDPTFSIVQAGSNTRVAAAGVYRVRTSVTMSGTVDAALLTVTSNVILTASSATFARQVQIENGGQLRLGSGTVTFGTNVTVNLGGRLDISNATTTVVLEGTLTNLGVMKWVTRFNYFTLRGSGRVENLGTWELYRDPAGPNGSGSSVGVSVNVPVGGKLLLSTNALVIFTTLSSLTVAGELEIQSGALLRLDSTSPPRTVTLAAESLLSGTGALQLDGGCQVVGLGGLDPTFSIVQTGNNTRVAAAGVYRVRTSVAMSGTVEALLTVTSNVVLTASSATFARRVQVENGGQLRLGSGTVTFATDVMVNLGGRLDISNATTTVVLEGTLTNLGVMKWVTRFNYFTLRGSGRVENLGTWELYRDPAGPNGSGSSVGVSVNVPVGGKLLLSTNALVIFTTLSSLTVAGELEIQSGALLRLDSTSPPRTVTLAAESLLSGTGALQLDGGCQVVGLGGLDPTFSIVQAGNNTRVAAAGVYRVRTSVAMSGTVEALLTVTSNVVLTASSATFARRVQVENGGQLRLGSGTVTFETNVTVNLGGRLDISNATTTVQLEGILTNLGAMKWVARFNYFTLRGSGRVENLGTWELYRDPAGPNGSGSSVGVSVNVLVGGKLLLSTNALVIFTTLSSLTVAGELEIQSGALLRLDSTIPPRVVTLTAESLLNGAGTLQLDGANHLALVGDVSIGFGLVDFRGTSRITGANLLTIAPSSTVLFDHSSTISGSVSVNGRLTLNNAAATLRINGNLTLNFIGTLNNSGIFSVAAFVNNGGTINGNPPQIFPGFAPAIAGPRISASAIWSADIRQVVLRWRSVVGARFGIETSPDLRFWSSQAVEIREISPGEFEAMIPAVSFELRFYRLRVLDHGL